MTQPQQGSNQPVMPMSLVVIVIYGVINAGGVGFLLTFLKDDPSRLAALIVALIILNILLTFALKVISPLFAELAGRFTENLRLTFSRYRKPYLDYITARTDYLDVKGMTTQEGQPTLELKRVYVNLAVMRDTRYTKDPIAVPQELVEGEHRLWDYLNDSRLGSLVIVGPPGSGKTTLLRYAALTLCERRSRRREVAPNKLPIFLYLREHADKIVENSDISLSEIVISTLKGVVIPPAGWFEKQLGRGACLIFLDGLDEVANFSTRRAVADWIERQMAYYLRCRFVVSSRPGGYKTNELARVSVLQVQPFNQRQQAQFITQWYMANEVMSAQKAADDLGVRLRAEEGADKLIGRIRNTPALSSLAVNPLLLTMIATVHRYRSELPGRRVELYAAICDVFLGKKQAAVGVEDGLTPAQKINVLQPLAYHLMEIGQRDIKKAGAINVIAPTLERVTANSDPEAFLAMIEDGSGLLLERENGLYSFAHLTFQEFLAAEHIQRNQLEHDLMRHVGESWWRETTRLYCARNDATRLIQACLGLAESGGGEITRSVEALALAVECLDEALEVEPGIRERIDAVTDQWLEDENPDRRRMAAEVLLRLRLNRLTRLDDDTYIDETGIADGFITHAEYQLFLDEMWAQDKFHQPEHWENYHFPPGQGRAPVVGVRSSDARAFCEWLTAREIDKSWVFILPITNDSFLQAHPGTGFWESNRLVFPKHGYAALDQGVLNNYVNSALALALARVRDRDLALARNLALARDLARTLALDLALYRDLARDLARVRDLARALDRALDLDLNLARARARVFDRDLARALDLTLDLDLDLDLEEIRYNALLLYETYVILAEILVSGDDAVVTHPRNNTLRWSRSIGQRQRTWGGLSKPGQPQAMSEVEVLRSAADTWIDVYLKLVIIEERRKGNLQAFEGIRIIKKRITQDEIKSGWFMNADWDPRMPP